MKISAWLKLTIPLIAVAVIVLSVQSCTGNITGDLTRIAEINSPREQAAANTERLLGEVKAQAEAERQAVLAAGQAQLELERARALQAQALKEQSLEQEAQHQRALGEIQANTAAELAKISVQAQADMAAIEAQRLTTIAGVVVRGLIIVGAIVISVIGMSTLRRVLISFAVKREHAANIPLMLNYDRRTATLPAFVVMVDNKPMLVDANVGAVMPLSESSKADLARARYLAAQNSIAVQTMNGADKRSVTLPVLESETRR